MSEKGNLRGKNYVREMSGQTLGAVQEIDFLGSRQSKIYRPDRILHMSEKIMRRRTPVGGAD